MPYRLQYSPFVIRQIRLWPMPDVMIVDVYNRLQAVASEPRRFLRPLKGTQDGMGYAFRMVDPLNRFCEHAFAFVLMYGQDEETLLVIRGKHRRTTIGS